MKKALGRCEHGHVKVVEYPPAALPSGICDKGEHKLVEWAVRYPAAPAG